MLAELGRVLRDRGLPSTMTDLYVLVTPPEVGYFLAFCFFAMAAYLIVAAFRASDEQKH